MTVDLLTSHSRHASHTEVPVDVERRRYAHRMSSPQHRRKRGTPTIALNMFVAPDVKALIDNYASISGAPQWAIVEAAIRAGSPDSSGLPAGWDLPTSQEGLPLTA